MNVKCSVFRIGILAILALWIFGAPYIIWSFDDTDLESKVEKYREKQEKHYLEPLELKLRLFQLNQEALDKIEERLKSLRLASKILIDPTRTGFNKVISKSTHPDTVNVYGSQGTSIGKYQLRVLQLATKDRIQSRIFKKDEKLSGGQLNIKASEKAVNVNLKKESTIQDVFNQLDEQSKDVYRVFLLSMSEEEFILVLESDKDGLKNRLSIGGDLPLLQNLGWSIPKLGQSLKKIDQPEIQSTAILDNQSFQYRPIEGKFRLDDGILSLLGKTKLVIQFDKPILINSKFFVKLTHRLAKNQIPEPSLDKEHDKDMLQQELQQELQTEKKQFVEYDELFGHDEVGIGPDVEIGGINFKGDALLKFLDVDLPADLPADSKDISEENMSDSKATDKVADRDDIVPSKESLFSLYFIFDDESHSERMDVMLQAQNDVPANLLIKWESMQESLKNLIPSESSVSALVLDYNPNDAKDMMLKNINLIRIEESSDLGRHYVQRAQNAKISFEGIHLEYPENVIKDIVPGVTLELKKQTKTLVDIEISRDYSQIIGQIKSLIQEYDDLMFYFYNMLSYSIDKQDRESIAEKVSSLDGLRAFEDEFNAKTSDERQYMKLSGLFYKGFVKDEISFRRLRDKIKSVIRWIPYSQSESKKRTIRFLKQIGVSDERTAGQVVDINALEKGFLKVDEEKLLKILKDYFNEVRDLFAYRTQGSVARDKGLLIKMIKLIDSYIQKGFRNKKGYMEIGLIAMRKKNIRLQLTKERRRLEDVKKTVNKRVTKFRTEMYKIKQLRERSTREQERMKSQFESMGK